MKAARLGRLPAALRPPSRRAVDGLLLAGLIFVVAALYSHYALRVGSFQNDEDLYTRLARYIAANFPQGLWAPYYTRGLQRLDPLIMAIPFSFMRGPGAFEFDHVLHCVLFSSTALPVFLLARSARLGRPASYLAALLSVVLPWGVVSTSFLNESLAYPAFAWVLYSAWQAVCRPSVKWEVLALVSLVVAAFSRTALLAMLPLAPLGVLWHTLSCELRGAPLARLRAAPGRLWARHRLMTIVLGVGILGFAAQALGLLPTRISNTLTGSYGIPQLNSLGDVWAKDRSYLSRMVAGTGYIPFAFALGWMAVTFVRPRDPARHGLAVVCLLGLLCELFSLLPAGPDERYVMYGAIPIVLAFVAGLTDRVGAGVVGGAVLTVLLIDSVTWPPLANLYDYFTFPAAIFYSRALGYHLGILGLSSGRIVEVGILLLSTCWVYATGSPRRAAPAAVVVALAVLGLVATQTLYTLVKYSSAAGAGLPAAERSWVDGRVPAAGEVTTLAIGLGTSASFEAVWRDAEFWNTSIKSTSFIGYGGYAPLPLELAPYSLSIGRGGVLSATEYGVPVSIPRLMLVPRVTTLPIALQAESASEDPALPLDLLRLSAPARVRWLMTGPSPEGFLAPGKPAEIHIYEPVKKGAQCAGFTLVGPPNYTGRWPYTVTAGGRTAARGSLASQEHVLVLVKAPSRVVAGQRLISIRVEDRGVLYPNGETVSARVESVTLGRCRSRPLS